MWSDGSDMSAEDVVFTWRYCSDVETGCTAESSFDGISSVEAVNDLTVKITFGAPTPYPYTAFVSAGTPVISRAQFADCVGKAAASCEAQKHRAAGHRRLSNHRLQGLTRRRFTSAIRSIGAPRRNFDRVVLKGGGDAISAARAAMERGEADYAWNLQVEPDVLAEMEADGNGK